MSVPALSDLIVLEKPSQSQEFFFSPFVDRGKHSRIEAEKRSLLGRSISSENWEQNCGRYCTFPEYFSE